MSNHAHPQNNNDGNHASSASASASAPPPAFPAGRTVPFPYERPYPQQVALMDALLRCLRLREEAEKRAAEEAAHNEDNNDHDACTNGNARGKKRRASIIMLESPTGTGKSLSLACSTVAWLRYREEMDLRAGAADDDAATSSTTGADDGMGSTARTVTPGGSNATSPTNNNNNTANNKNASGGTNTGLDWIDSFLSPEQQAQQDYQRQIEDGRRRALAARRLLNDELGKIRDRLDRAASNATVNVGGGGGGEDQKADKKAARQAKVRTVRENLARSAATAAAIAERKQSRHRHRRGGGKGSVVKRSRSNISGIVGANGKGDNDVEMDYCLEEYNSDDNIEGTTSSRRASGSIDNYDSSDDEEKAPTSSIDASGIPNQKLQQQPKHMLPSEILAGGRLDGSNYDPTQRYRNGGKHDDDDALSPTTPTAPDALQHPTIGSVQPGSGVRKIVYAARTHSQLSQFVGELRRTAWGQDLRVVALGGRKLLCGNKEVLGPKHRSEKIITERCLDLQKGKKTGGGKSKAGDKRKSGEASSASSTSGCPLLSSREAVSALAVHVLALPSDIEDIGSLGKASHACAYYASRGSLTAAEVVVVPYNTLLSTQARAAVGLSLHNALVVIDEAHNVPEALRGLSSSRLTLPIIKAATEQLTAYTRKYASRLAGRNLFYLGQIRRCLTAMTKYLGKKPAVVGTSTSPQRLSTLAKSPPWLELLHHHRVTLHPK